MANYIQHVKLIDDAGDKLLISTDGAALVQVADTLDITASGTITTQNLVSAGAATAGSAVEIATNGRTTLGIQTVGTYTGALSLQGTIDGTVWVTTSDTRISRFSSTTKSSTIASGIQSIFQTPISGFLKVRVTGLAAMSGSVVVTLIANSGPSMFTNTVVSDEDGLLLHVITSGSDALVNTTNELITGAMNYSFNDGTATWDRKRNNSEVPALTSAARTVTTSSADLTLHDGKGITVTLDVTAQGGANTLTLTIDYKDSLSNKYINLLTSALVTAVSVNKYKVYPGLTASANLVVNDVVPRLYRVTVTVGDTVSATYSISVQRHS